MFRSLASVLIAIFAWGAAWVAANTGVAAALPTLFDDRGITTDPGVLVFFIVFCAFLCTLAGWLCAAIARGSRMKHVAALAAIQLTIGIFVQTSVWDFLPVWYHLTFLGLVVPMHLVGGWIRVGRWSLGGVSSETTLAAQGA